jgi:hypothetical protein
MDYSMLPGQRRPWDFLDTRLLMLSASDEVPEQGRDNSSGRDESRHEIAIITSKETWIRAIESILRQQKPSKEMSSDKLLMVVEES